MAPGPFSFVLDRPEWPTKDFPTTIWSLRGVAAPAAPSWARSGPVASLVEIGHYDGYYLARNPFIPRMFVQNALPLMKIDQVHSNNINMGP